MASKNPYANDEDSRVGRSYTGLANVVSALGALLGVLLITVMSIAYFYKAVVPPAPKYKYLDKVEVVDGVYDGQKGFIWDGTVSSATFKYEYEYVVVIMNEEGEGTRVVVSESDMVGAELSP